MMESNHDAKINTDKLLRATKNKEYGFVTTLLTESGELYLDTTDDVGKTVLHHLCNAGRTSEIDLCLKKGARVNKTDKLGWTPLHYAAIKGHKEIIHTLVNNGADINKTDDEKGRTALHLAVSRDHHSIAEHLIQLGTNINIKDQAGKTAMDISKNEVMREQIQTVAKKVAEEIAEKERLEAEESEVIREEMDIPLDKSTPFPNLGLIVTPKPDTLMMETDGEESSEKSFTLSIKKSFYDSSQELFDIKDDEEVCSELFEYEVSRVTGPVVIDICIPITFPPTNNEELVLKTDRGNEILVDHIHEEQEKWICNATAEITSFSSFIVISKPKMERFDIGSGPANITSTVDKRVELEIPQNTFDKACTITMGITDTPKEDELAKVLSGCDAVLSTTAFYSLDSGGMELLKPISLKVPLPTTYQGEGHLIVLTMNDDPDKETPESWKMLSTVNEIKNDRIYFDVPTFSIKVSVEVPSVSTTSLETFGSTSSFASISSQVSRIYRKCRRREYAVTLLCFSRRLGTSNTFKIVVQCCKDDQVQNIVTGWEYEGYVCHSKIHDKQSGEELKVRSKQKFKVVPKDLNLLEQNDIIVEFLPKLESSHQVFNIRLPSNMSMMKGKLSFVKMEKAANNDSDPATTGQELVEGDTVSSVDVSFLMFHPGMLSELDGTNFLSYKIMIEIQEEMGDKWWKCLLLMDIPFTTIEKTFVESTGNLPETINGLLFDWREKHRGYKSRGLPVMLSALNRCGRRGLVNDLQIKLRTWKNTPSNRNDVFYDWLITAYKHDLLISASYDAPMTDLFFAMVADKMQPTNELVTELSLPAGTFHDITDNKKCYPCEGMISMKVFDIFRKAYTDKPTSFSKLVKSLRNVGQTEAANYALMLAGAWLKKQGTENSEFFDVIIELSSK